VETKWMKRTVVASAVVLAATSAGCGEFVRDQGRAPVQVVITQLTAASGAEPDALGTTLRSDVLTNVRTPDPCTPETPCPTIFNDIGEVTMSLVLKDPGQPGITAVPTALNQVTFTRYRVTYRRTDGRNAPGVDVPFPFDSAVTFTVPHDGSATAGFQIVRHSAKEEAPLRGLAVSGAIISTITEVTFFGRDQAGNDVTATGSIGIDFGNFADPS
jgi:hypothetical protein